MHQQPEPSTTSNIIFHNVYATSKYRTCMYTHLHQGQLAYKSTNTNLKLHSYSRLQSYRDHNIYRIECVSNQIQANQYHIIQCQFIRSHDPDPTLNSRCTKYFKSYHNHSPCNIKYTSNRSIRDKPLSLAHLGLLIFSSLYSFGLSHYL